MYTLAILHRLLDRVWHKIYDGIDVDQEGLARVREAAPALAENAERADVRRAAEELIKRIEPDPLMKGFLAIAIALLVVVSAYAYLSH